MKSPSTRPTRSDRRSTSQVTRPKNSDAKPATPPVRDAARMRQRILNVAATEFAKRGYDGARIDEIVRRCRISKNLVYYYFDSKEALFIAVLEKAYSKLRQRQEKMDLEHIEPIEGIKKLVIDSFEYWGKSKNFIAYLNSENFNDARHIRKSVFVRGAYTGLVASLRDLLQRGEQEKIFRPGVDPIQLYISISALAYHFFSNQRTFSVIFGKNFHSREMLDERLSHVQDVVLGYLQCVPHKKAPAAE